MKGQTVSPGSYKEEQGGCGGPQERLINGCCDVVKGKAAAWDEGETNENGCCGSPEDQSVAPRAHAAMGNMRTKIKH